MKRCFIFTEKGRTFLDKTVRRKIPCRGPDEKVNNPPWIQAYVGTWRDVPKIGPEGKVGSERWTDYSTDRYITPIIGTVSKDGKYLAVIANDSADEMWQVWKDCMHNNPKWLPADAPPDEKRWRVKIYVMENDTYALLARVGKDFPDAVRHVPYMKTKK